MTLSTYVNEIAEAARVARTESQLEGELNHILKRCLHRFGVQFTPHVNETLKKLGLSQVSSTRPDGVFGHIVYDYKAPGTLVSPGRLAAAKRQLEGYLDAITAGHRTDAAVCRKWFGYITDGRLLVYCVSDGYAWRWSQLPITESTLLFLVHAYRALQRKPLTAALLSAAFGKSSDVIRELVPAMCSQLTRPREKTNMLFREWRRLFEQVSIYGIDELPSLKNWATTNGIVSNDASSILFALHTYYSLVVKLLTSELLAVSAHGPSSICEDVVATTSAVDLRLVMARVENGEYFRQHRIANFLEGDFFSWYVEEPGTPLADGIRSVARTLLEFEPASGLLRPETKQDLLKEFYSSLVDEQIRHDLGEYYTPDWLAQHVLDRATYHGDAKQRVLDPACGSGTFLVEVIGRLKRACSDAGMSPINTLSTILRNVKGLDLNPLAVISARANYVLSIHDLVFSLGSDIELPVYLADCINIPTEREDESGESYLEYYLDTELGTFVLEIPACLVRNSAVSHVLLTCEEAIGHGDSAERFLSRLRSIPSVSPHLSRAVTDRLERFYATIESLEARNWDKIWCRIIKNNFSPRGFGSFDLVVGNPPWVRWSRLPAGYRNRVKAFCQYYGLVSGHGYSGGIESDISTVITFSAADNWLRDGGTIAFLITWTVFKSNSARGFRRGELPENRGLSVQTIEDLTRVRAFADALNETGVYVATKVTPSDRAHFTRTTCKIWIPQPGKSRIPTDASLADAYAACDIVDGAACPIGGWGTPLFTGDIDSFAEAAFLRGDSEYRGASHRGTISDCARVYWVKLLKYSAATHRALIRTLTEAELPRARQVDPVTGMWIEADLLYPLVRGRDVGRYCAESAGWYQIIPNVHYETVDEEQVFANKYPLAYSYLCRYKDVLSRRSTYRRYQQHLPFYVIYCVGEYSFSEFKVVWLEQQDPAKFRCAVVQDVEVGWSTNGRIVPDHKLYFATCQSEMEAHYLCGFLNSSPVRNWLGGFLLKKQIGTSIFEHMRLPRYSSRSAACRAIANISRVAHGERVKSREKAFLGADEERKLAAYVREVCQSEVRAER